MVDERGAQARTHGAGVTGAIECRYYGRDFSAGEMALLRALIAGPPPLNRHTLSKEFCRRIGWLKPDGGLKDMMARVTMLAMHRDGLIVLPTPQGRQNRPGPIVFGPDTDGTVQVPRADPEGARAEHSERAADGAMSRTSRRPGGGRQGGGAAQAG